ncbi:hypothetical protein Emed_003325 [Eimeria media]
MAALLRDVQFKTDDEEPALFTLSEQPNESHHLRAHARSRRQKGVRLQAVVALVVTMVFLMAITTCFHLSRKAVRGRHEHGGRRLAAGQDSGQGEEEDSLLSDILEECLDMEEEFGSSPDDREKGGEDDDKLLSQILSESLEMQEELDMPLSHPPLPEEKQAVSQTLSSIYQLQQAVTQVHSEDVSALFPHQLQVSPSPLPPEHLQSIVSQVPSTTLSAAASALPELYFPTEASHHVSITSAQPEQPGPSKAKTKRKWTSPTTTAFGEEPELKKQKPTSAQRRPDAGKVLPGEKIHGYPAVTDILGQQDEPPQRAEVESSEFPVASTSHQAAVAVSHVPVPPVPAVPAAVTGVVSPAGDAAALEQAEIVFPLPPPAPLMPSTTHLYYRLPTVLPGTIRKEFSTLRAFSTIGCSSAHPYLIKIRHLLTRRSITPEQAEVLIYSCEELYTYLLRYHRTPVQGRKASDAAFVLSRRFLCLEAVFTVIQVVGPAMRAELWWSKLLNAVPTDVQYPIPVLRPKVVEAVHLARRLSSALASLKRGIRPTLEETVALKRILFKKASINLRFTELRWEPWREDDPEDPPGMAT